MNLKQPIKGWSKEFGKNEIRMQKMKNICAKILMQYVTKGTKL